MASTTRRRGCVRGKGCSVGLFKDMKKLSDQGKEMNKAMGRPTTLTGMMKDLPNQMAQASQAMDQAQASIADQQLLTTGTPARGTITNFADTGMLINYSPSVVLDLQVTMEGRDPYAAQITSTVPQIYLGKLQVGAGVALRVDPADPERMIVDWAQP